MTRERREPGDVSLLGPLRQVALPVNDLDRAVAFYRDVLGLAHMASFGTLAFFDLAGIRLLLEVAGADQARGGVLYLAVDDIQAAHDTLVRRGVTFQSTPHLIFRDEQGHFGASGEEEWMAFFLDSEGNQLALSSRQRD
jgi:predicted enzyme related to lactoylglutathione lyase